MVPITSEQIAALPKYVLMREPRTRGANAREKLSLVLHNAILSLRKLETDPIVIATSPYRFNDVYYSDWRAVRIGDFFTERHDYARLDYEQDLRSGPKGARSARAVLDRLEEDKWGDLFVQAFDVKWGDCGLALVLQDGLPWLVFSSSNASDENHVFALWHKTPVQYFGECLDRFDWAMQDTPPLRFQPVEPDPARSTDYLFK
jgi:hypothetical protein